jgi:chemotaxis protein histidine kinase CheA/CheY-like chemotaxis protein
MSSQLDPAILAAINQEARQCFLEEDAPEYLQTLEEGFQNRQSPDYTSLLRATHSLKGGAGIAQLPSLKELAHKLEDLLQALQKGQIEQAEKGWQLIERGIGEIAFILSQAQSSTDDVLVDAQLLSSLAVFSQPEPLEAIETSSNSSNDNALVKTALTEDLESSLTAVANLPSDSPPESIKQCLENFYDECSFLGETLNLAWVVDTLAPLEVALKESSAEEVFLLAQEILTQLRQQREEYLSGGEEKLEPFSQPPENQELTASNNQLIINSLNEDLEDCLSPVAQLSANSPPESIKHCLENFYDECSFLGETLNLAWIVETVAPLETAISQSPPQQALGVAKKIIAQLRRQRDEYLQPSLAPSNTKLLSNRELIHDVVGEQGAGSKGDKAPLSQLRIPLKRLEAINNGVEELILIQSRIQLQQQQLKQANRRLQQITRQFEPLRDQIQTLYNQLAIESANVSSVASADEEENQIFDALELDRYSELHISLQSFQELILQVQETRTDLNVIDQDLGEDLEQIRKNLDVLYQDVTQSRLVPFRLLAQRFLPQIHHLNRRFTDKSVRLEIEGENTLIDQLLLEQLQTPLTHLLNNAFDHGIETSSERLAQQKAETAQIILEAKVDNNQLIISLKDDGRGIDRYKVYQRAIALGLCPADKAFKDLSQEEILNWIFQSDFSTAERVSDLSGRGMGLDIVRVLVRKLRGNIQVFTQENKGTTFTLTFPLNLSLMSLFLLNVGNRTFSIPINTVRETLPYPEINWLTTEPPTANWQQQKIPVVYLSNLLSSSAISGESTSGRVAMVVQAYSGLVMIIVDAILSEEQLIVKPFDETVPTPSYIAGCTILGTGKIVPVILPQAFAFTNLTSEPLDIEPVTTTEAENITILVAEDSVATRRLLERLLTAMGYQVVACRDGKAALEELEHRQGGVNLILSDVEMPRVNGFQLLQKVRAHKFWQNIPVVMATSRTGDRHRNQAMQLGANGYLGKPIQPQELLATIEPLLAKKNSLF